MLCQCAHQYSVHLTSKHTAQLQPPRMKCRKQVHCLVEVDGPVIMCVNICPIFCHNEVAAFFSFLLSSSFLPIFLSTIASIGYDLVGTRHFKGFSSLCCQPCPRQTSRCSQHCYDSITTSQLYVGQWPRSSRQRLYFLGPPGGFQFAIYSFC